MHWDCYAKWEHQAEFAALYFQASVDGAEGHKGHWPVLHRSERLLVTFGIGIHEFALTFRRSGTQIRVPEDRWLAWLESEWPESCEHELERATVEEVIEEVRGLVK